MDSVSKRMTRRNLQESSAALSAKINSRCPTGERLSRKPSLWYSHSSASSTPGRPEPGSGCRGGWRSRGLLPCLPVCSGLRSDLRSGSLWRCSVRLGPTFVRLLPVHFPASLVVCRQHLSAPGGAHDGGDALLRGETADQTDQESRSAGTEPQVDFSCRTEQDMGEPTQEVRMSAKKATQKSEGFTDEERDAMKERARELKAEARANKKKAEGESDVLAKIAEMPEADRAMAERLHEIVKASAPALLPKTWYGMPAYAKGGKVVCFFQSAQKFNARYATLGFNDAANLDEGAMWPTSFALKELSATEEARIGALVKRAVS